MEPGFRGLSSRVLDTRENQAGCLILYLYVKASETHYGACVSRLTGFLTPENLNIEYARKP